MTPGQAVLVAASGLVGGAINAAAGGGSLVTFPALLNAGLPPLTANVSNTVGLVPGYVGGIAGLRNREELPELDDRPLLLTGLAGALVGVALLLTTPARVFALAAPVLVLLASVLLLGQPWLLPRLQGRGHGGRRPVRVTVFLGSVYGAYFGAALGVLLLALLDLFSTAPWKVANAVKARLSLVVNLAAAVLFVALAPVRWDAVLLLGLTSPLGGWLGGDLARRVPVPALRALTASLGVVAAVTLLL